MAHQGDAVLHADDDLLPDPLGYQVVAEHDHDGARHEPDGEEGEEGIVEPALSDDCIGTPQLERDLTFSG